jgi:hypothetical protein
MNRFDLAIALMLIPFRIEQKYHKYAHFIVEELLFLLFCCLIVDGSICRYFTLLFCLFK